MKRPLTLGLRGRLLLLLLTAFALLFGAIFWQSLEDRDDRLRHAADDLLRHTQLIAARQQHIAAQADAILATLMGLPELQPGASATTCARVLAAHLGKESEFIQIGKVLPNGAVVCAAVPAKGPVDFSDRNWFQRALMTQEMTVGDVVIGRILGKPLITFAKAMHDETGRVTGVLYLSLDLAWLQRELAKAALPEGARLTVVDAKGTVAVRHPDLKGLAGKNIADRPLFQHILAQGGAGTLEDIGLDGVRRINGYTPLLDTASGRMILWLSVPKAAVEAPLLRELWINLATALALLIATLGLVVWGSERLLLRPLSALVWMAARFRVGDLGARSGLPHGDDEIGRLAGTLDEMAAAVEDRERRLAHANRALRVLSAGNRTLLRAHDEPHLMEEMCRAIVEAGGYLIAWVGLAGSDRRVRPVALWGAEADFFAGLNITWDETETGRGPAGTAIRRGMPVACNDVRANPDYAPWREQAQRYGYAASLALPLRLDGAVAGVLVICATEADAFGDDVAELFGETADDLAYGIAVRRAAIEHERAQAEFGRLERRHSLILNAAGEGIYGLDLEGRTTFINPAGTAMLQWPVEELVGQAMHDLHHHTRADGTPYTRETCPIYAALHDGAIHRVADEVFWRRDGSSFPVEYVSTPLRDERGELAGAVVSFIDITERRRAETALRAHESQLQTIVENLTEGLVVADLDGQVLHSTAPRWTCMGIPRRTNGVGACPSSPTRSSSRPWTARSGRWSNGRWPASCAARICAIWR